MEESHKMFKNMQGTEAFKEFSKEFEKRECPRPLHVGEIKKENAWIVWLTDGHGKIVDLEVYERFHDDQEESEKTFYYVNERLGGQYKDIGCVCAQWDEWDMADVIFKFGCQYGFTDREVMIKALKRLKCIKEFKSYISRWLDYVGE